MSFSFTAGGSKEQALSTLEITNVNGDPFGAKALAFARDLVESDQTVPDSATHKVRYLVSSTGHSSPGMPPYVNLSFTVSFEPKGEQP